MPEVYQEGTRQERCSLVIQDAADITVSGFGAASTAEACALIRLRDVVAFFVHGCCPRAAQTAFLSLNGAGNDQISIIGNDFSRLSSVIHEGAEMRPAALFEEGNRR
jgi:hypothetical protein